MAIIIWMASPGVKASVEEHFPFTSYEARYDILWHGLKAGESVHKLTKKGENQYYFESKTFPNVKVIPFYQFESSNFIWQNGTIQPTLYTCDIKEGKRHKFGKVSFDWANRKISNNLPEVWQSNLPEGVQDKLTQTFSMRAALKKGSHNLNYHVAELDKFKDYHFMILGPERLRTKIGLIDTIKLKHTSKKGYETLMWLAIKLDYLPVKMQQTRNHKIVAAGSILSFTPQINHD